MPHTDTGDAPADRFPINGVAAAGARGAPGRLAPAVAAARPGAGNGDGDGPILIVTDRVVPDVDHDPGALGALARAMAGRGREVHLAAVARQGPDRSWHDGRLHLHAFASVPLPARVALGVASVAGPGGSLRAVRPGRLAGRVTQLLDTVCPQLVHGYTGPLLTRTVLAAAAARGLTTVVTCQPPPPASPSGPLRAAGLAVQRWRWSDTVRQLTAADLATVTSPALAVLLRAHGLTKHLAYLRTPVDGTRWHTTPGWQRLGAPVIGHAGTLHADSGVETLLDAVALLNPQLRFVVAIAGDGPAYQSLQRHSQAVGGADRVRFLGRVPHAEMPDFYARCSLLVAPTRIPSLGAAVIEAMASGLPVLAATPGSASDLIEDGYTGQLYRAGDTRGLADRLTALLLDPDTRDRLGAAAQAAAGEHHVTVLAERLDGVYHHAHATAATRRAHMTLPEPRPGPNP